MGWRWPAIIINWQKKNITSHDLNVVSDVWTTYIYIYTHTYNQAPGLGEKLNSISFALIGIFMEENEIKKKMEKNWRIDIFIQRYSI